MIVKEYGGGIESFTYLVLEADQQMVDLAYYAILRRYQMEHLHTIDREEWPSPVSLIDYQYTGPVETDYYNGNSDLFISLGEWLKSYREQERRKNWAAKQKR